MRHKMMRNIKFDDYWTTLNVSISTEDLFPTFESIFDDSFSFSFQTVLEPELIAVDRVKNIVNAAATSDLEDLTANFNQGECITVPDLEREHDLPHQSVAQSIAPLEVSFNSSSVSKSSFQVSVLEEFKCAIRGNEMKSQLIGLVHSSEPPSAPLELKIVNSAQDLLINPALESKRNESNGTISFAPYERKLNDEQDHITLLKYKSERFQIPLCVKSKSTLKTPSSTSTFIMLQIDVAMNKSYHAKNIRLSEVKVSLRGLASLCGALNDGRSKQVSGFGFSFDREKAIASWFEVDGVQNTSLYTFVARIESESCCEESKLANVAIPTIVNVRFPLHLVSSSEFSARYAEASENNASSAIDVTLSSKLEYTFS